MKIKILGSGQDAGTPHAGCYCEICTLAREDKKYRRLSPSIAIYDNDKGYCYMIDTSPDFKVQLDMVKEEIATTHRNGKIPIDGILLTHAHYGHISGLWQLGTEALGEHNLPVFCTSKLKHMFETNYPYSLLVERKNIELREIWAGQRFELEDFQVIPIQVPHRDEVADTVGYLFNSDKSLIYIPDIDYWPDHVVDEVKKADIALIDGSFYTKTEISRYDEVAHPTIQDTMKLLKNIKTGVYFTHLNHTNPVNFDGNEKKFIVGKGFNITYDGLKLDI